MTQAPAASRPGGAVPRAERRTRAFPKQAAMAASHCAREPWRERRHHRVLLRASSPAELMSPSSMPLSLMALERSTQPVASDDTALRSAIVNVAKYYLRMAQGKTPARMEALIWQHDSIDGVDHRRVLCGIRQLDAGTRRAGGRPAKLGDGRNFVPVAAAQLGRCPRRPEPIVARHHLSPPGRRGAWPLAPAGRRLPARARRLGALRRARRGRHEVHRRGPGHDRRRLAAQLLRQRPRVPCPAGRAGCRRLRRQRRPAQCRGHGGQPGSGNSEAGGTSTAAVPSAGAASALGTGTAAATGSGTAAAAGTGTGTAGVSGTAGASRTAGASGTGTAAVPGTVGTAAAGGTDRPTSGAGSATSGAGSAALPGTADGTDRATSGAGSAAVPGTVATAAPATQKLASDPRPPARPSRALPDIPGAAAANSAAPSAAGKAASAAIPGTTASTPTAGNGSRPVRGDQAPAGAGRTTAWRRRRGRCRYTRDRRAFRGKRRGQGHDVGRGGDPRNASTGNAAIWGRASVPRPAAIACGAAGAGDQR